MSGDRGSALIIALLLTALLAALGIGLVALSNTERAIAANYRAAHESLYAADAALERSLLDLSQLPDWNGVLAGAMTSAFVDASLQPTLPSGGPLDLVASTANVQAASDATASWGANNPVWHLFAYGPLARLVGAGGISSSAYLVVWVADDHAETDGDPSVDSNGVVMILARAFGPDRSVRSIEVTVEKPVPGVPGVRLLAWRESF